MNFKKSILLFSAIVLSTYFIVGCVNLNNEQEPKIESDYVLEINNGTRFFKSEVIPKSESEEVILDRFKIEINDNYDKLKEIYIDSEIFNYYPKMYKEKLSEGLYTEEITIHNLVKLSEEEYSNNSTSLKYYYYMDRLKEYNPYEFQIIEVNYTNKFTDELNKIAQWGNGNWIRYFVVVKENENSDWRIFDVYGHM